MFFCHTHVHAYAQYDVIVDTVALACQDCQTSDKLDVCIISAGVSAVKEAVSDLIPKCIGCEIERSELELDLALCALMAPLRLLRHLFLKFIYVICVIVDELAIEVLVGKWNHDILVSTAAANNLDAMTYFHVDDVDAHARSAFHILRRHQHQGPEFSSNIIHQSHHLLKTMIDLIVSLSRQTFQVFAKRVDAACGACKLGFKTCHRTIRLFCVKFESLDPAGKVIGCCVGGR